MIATVPPFTSPFPTYLARTGVITGLSIAPCLGVPPFICFVTHSGPCSHSCVYYLITPSFAAYFLRRLEDPAVISKTTKPELVKLLGDTATLIRSNIPAADLASAPPWKFPDITALTDITCPVHSTITPVAMLHITPERQAALAHLSTLPVLAPGELEAYIENSRAKRRSYKTFRRKALK